VEWHRRTDERRSEHHQRVGEDEGKDMLEETDKRDGKVVGVFKMTVAADGKTAKASFD
jgi:hypothetical protein